MSDTPRTDAQAYDFTNGQSCIDGVVSSNFARELERENAALREELEEALFEIATLKASDEYNFGILKKCHSILGMSNAESYSLIPGEIEEWMCSHRLVKEKEVRATDRAVRLQQALKEAKP